MATIAALIVDVAANTASIDRSTRQIQTQLDGIGSAASKMGKMLAGAFTVTAVVAAGQQVLEYAGHVSDLSARLGVSTDAIQEWEAAFGPAGISIDTVAKSAAELSNRIVGGDKSAVAALQKMGLSVQELRQLSPEDQFNKVADAVGSLQDQGEKIYASKTLFGKGGVELLSALDGKLQENIQSFNDLGLIIDEQTIKAADDFGDQIGMMGKQLLGIVATVVGPLLPALSALGEVLSWLGRNIVGPVLGGAIKVAMTLLAGFVEVVTGLLGKLASLGSNLPLVGDKFAAMAGALDDVSKRSGAYMADLWKLDGAQQSVGDSATKTAPTLLGLGDASEKAGKKHDDQAEALARLEEKIADIGRSTQAGLWAPSKADLSDSLDAYVEGLQQFADARDQALAIERGHGAGGVWNIGVQLDTDAAEQALATLKTMASKSFSGILSTAVSSLPQILQQSLTGGGGMKGAFKALASQIGGGIGEKIFSAGGMLNGLGNKLTGIFGSAFGLALPGIGQALGAVVGPVLGKIVGKIFNNPEKQINPVREAFVQAAGGLSTLNQRAHDAGVTLDHLLDARTPEAYKAAIDELNAAFQFQDQAMQTLDETVKKYNFTNEQIGPILQRQQLGKTFEELFRDYQVLHAGGVDQVAVTQQMSDAVSKYVQDAKRMGIEIPAAMRPMLENFAQNGDLLDENGNAITDLSAYGVSWAETMTESVAKIVKSVNELVDAIDRGLGAALRNIQPPVVTGRVSWEIDPIPGNNTNDFNATLDPVPMASGGIGTVTRPTLFLVGEAGREQFAFSGANQRFAEASGGSVVNLAEVRAEMARLNEQQARLNDYMTGMFSKDLSRAMRDEVQKVSGVRR